MMWPSPGPGHAAYGGPPATGYSFSGPSGGSVGVASIPFTVALTPPGGSVPGPVTITPSAGAGGGTFSPASVNLTTGNDAIFTYTPASTGAKTLSVTNNGGLPNPAPLTYTVVASGLADGAPVGNLPDSSGNGRNATQVGINRPIFKVAIVGGKPVLRLNSTDPSWMNIPPMLGGIAFPWTIIAVFKPASQSGAMFSVGTTNPPGGGYGWTGPYQNASGEFNFSTDSAFYKQTSATHFGAAFHVITATPYAAYFGDRQLRVDGVDIGASGFFTSNGGDLNVIGTSINLGVSDGDIADLVLFNEILPATDIANAEKFIGNDYSIAVAGGVPVNPLTINSLWAWYRALSLL